ncbi:MAG TPA: VanZ family protein [Solirubrobacterales bacterium]|nr:VanZ family protein [Solirubrobacterales bacterium]
MNPRNRALLRALAPLALMGVIFYLSAQPSSGEHAWWDIIFRKLGHVTGYALLTALWWWALRGVSSRPLLIAVCIAFAYAWTDEFHQTFVHGRTGTPVDVCIDAIGMTIAALVIRWRRPPRARPENLAPGPGVSRSSPARSP